MIEPTTLNNLAGNAREQLELVRARATHWDEKLRTFTREQPLLALGCALAGGFVLARLASVRFRS